MRLQNLAFERTSILGYFGLVNPSEGLNKKSLWFVDKTPGLIIHIIENENYEVGKECKD